jgi:hypothetical protein
MNSTAILRRAALAFAGALILVFAAGATAQVQSETRTAPAGQATHQVTVDRATVVYASGNEVVVRLANGELKHFTNVPDSVRINVDGKQLSVHDLKPGMIVQRTVVKTTTPEIITTVQSVSGRVWHVNPPLSVILTLDDGKNQEFKIPQGQKFKVNGQMVDAWGLRKGMNISATRVVEVPQTTVSQNTAYAAATPPPPPQDQPILVAVVTPARAAPEPAPAAPAAPQENLPKTASSLPLIGLLGLICLGGSFSMRLLRRS